MKKIIIILMFICCSMLLATDLFRLIPNDCDFFVQINSNQMLNKAGTNLDGILQNFDNGKDKDAITKISSFIEALEINNNIFVYKAKSKEPAFLVAKFDKAEMKKAKLAIKETVEKNDKSSWVEKKIGDITYSYSSESKDELAMLCNDDVIIIAMGEIKEKDIKKLFEKKDKFDRKYRKLVAKDNDISFYANLKQLITPNLHPDSFDADKQLAQAVSEFESIYGSVNFENGKAVTNIKMAFNDKSKLKQWEKIYKNKNVSKQLFEHFDYNNCFAMMAAYIDFEETDKAFRKETKNNADFAELFKAFDKFVKERLNNYKPEDVLNGEVVASVEGMGFGMGKVDFKIAARLKSAKKLEKILKTNKDFAKKYGENWAVGEYKDNIFFPSAWLKIYGETLIVAANKSKLAKPNTTSLPESYKNIAKSLGYLAVNLEKLKGMVAMFSPELAKNKGVMAAKNIIVKGSVGDVTIEINSNLKENVLKTIYDVITEKGE